MVPPISSGQPGSYELHATMNTPNTDQTLSPCEVAPGKALQTRRTNRCGPGPEGDAGQPVITLLRHLQHLLERRGLFTLGDLRPPRRLRLNDGFVDGLGVGRGWYSIAWLKYCSYKANP